jgi:dihydrolipoamide dehydrogenase
MNETPYDVVVIGAGPGGYVAAIRAAQLGLRTAVVERQALGGVCLNVGCIPTKALLHTADLLDEAREGRRFGVVAKQVALDWAAALKHKEQVVKQMTGGVGFLLKKHQIDVYSGTARLAGPGSVRVTDGHGKGTALAAKHVIVATGARAKDLPGIGAAFDEDRILSSTGALDLKEVPRSLLIIGAGAIGVEFASMYRTFGAEVTLVEMLPRIVPNEDEEISAELTRALAKRGITVLAGARLAGVERDAARVVATVVDATEQEQRITAECVLLGIGITPNTADLGLEELGVARDPRGYIEVNGMMQTNVPGLYAIGDCVPTPWLAHVASAEGIIAVEHIAGHHPPAIDYDRVPFCTYSNPEVASVGLTEAEARARGHEVRVGRFPFAANGKATILGQRTGFVKVVSAVTYQEVLGLHLIGPRVTELIAEGTVALTHEANAASLMRTIHAHPTLYEALGEAAHAAADGAAIHI